MPWPTTVLYLAALASIARATCGLVAHGLRHPGRPALLRPDGRIQPLPR